MAILVTEEGERKIDVISIVMWLSLLTLVGVAAYFIFFKRPDLVQIASPSDYQNIDPLANVSLDPTQVTNSDAFQSLQQYVPLPAPAETGRENPFIAP